MPAPRILFVKLSSLGDVVHHMSAITDLRAHRPDVHIAWAVEEAYAELVALHPAVAEVIPIGLRALRGNILDAACWRRLGAARRALSRGGWDYVIDSQGLLKSALVARAAHGAVFGLDRASARERLAARFYDVKIAVPRALHAVERNRRLVAEIFGYPAGGPPNYGIEPPPSTPAWAPAGRYAVLLHAASRAAKHWPANHWIELGRRLARHGVASVFPGGSAAERAIAARLAASVDGAMAAPPMPLTEAAALLGRAALVAGVDTGLTHLAVALRRTTVGIYCATRAELTGLHGANAINLGAPGQPPSVDAVAAALGYAPEPAAFHDAA